MTPAEQWDAIYQSGRPSRLWPSEDVIAFCSRRLQTDAVVLDAGCGTGANTWALTAMRYHTLAIDASPTALALAKILCQIRDPEGVEWAKFRRAELGKIGEAVGSTRFDAIIDCRVSQHVAWLDHQKVYEEYFQLLKPGGWLSLVHLEAGTDDSAANWPENTVNRIDQYSWSNIVRGNYKDNGLVCMPPLQALIDCLRAANFSVVRREWIQRRFTDGGDYAWKNIVHVSIDAQRPLTS